MCEQLLKSAGGSFPPGNVVSTGAYRLKQKQNPYVSHIVHVVWPMFALGDAAEKQYRDSVFAALNHAKTFNVDFITIPLLGVDSFGWTHEIASVLLVESVLKWIQQGNTCNRICFVNENVQCCDALLTAIEMFAISTQTVPISKITRHISSVENVDFTIYGPLDKFQQVQDETRMHIDSCSKISGITFDIAVLGNQNSDTDAEKANVAQKILQDAGIFAEVLQPFAEDGNHIVLRALGSLELTRGERVIEAHLAAVSRASTKTANSLQLLSASNGDSAKISTPLPTVIDTSVEQISNIDDAPFLCVTSDGVDTPHGGQSLLLSATADDGVVADGVVAAATVVVAATVKGAANSRGLNKSVKVKKECSIC